MKHSTSLPCLALAFSMHLFMFVLAGCKREAKHGMPGSKAQGSELLAESANWSPHPDILGSRKEFEWTPARIRRHHAGVILADCPEYVVNLRGWGGDGASESEFAMWGGIVPPEHIEDFKDYIRVLGVPERSMSQTRPTRGVRRDEDWTPPDPPATRLVFKYSIVCNGSGTALGLSFTPGAAMSYKFDNPNLPNSSLHLVFSEQTGYFYFTERFIDI